MAWRSDRAVMAYKGTETDVLYGVEMAWRADATAHARLMLSFQVNRLSSLVYAGLTSKKCPFWFYSLFCVSTPLENTMARANSRRMGTK